MKDIGKNKRLREWAGSVKLRSASQYKLTLAADSTSKLMARVSDTISALTNLQKKYNVIVTISKEKVLKMYTYFL